MPLDELIAKLTHLRNNPPMEVTPEIMGRAVVNLKCPVAKMPCWILKDGISAGDEGGMYVQIEGGFGA